MFANSFDCRGIFLFGSFLSYELNDFAFLALLYTPNKIRGHINYFIEPLTNIIKFYQWGKGCIDYYFRNLPITILELIYWAELKDIPAEQAAWSLFFMSVIFAASGGIVSTAGYPVTLSTILYYAAAGTFLYIHPVANNTYVFDSPEWLSLQYFGSRFLRGPCYSACIHYFLPNAHPLVIFLFL